MSDNRAIRMLDRLAQKAKCLLTGCAPKLVRTTYGSGCLSSVYVCACCGKRHSRSVSSAKRKWALKMEKRKCECCLNRGTTEGSCTANMTEADMGAYCKKFKRDESGAIKETRHGLLH